MCLAINVESRPTLRPGNLAGNRISVLRLQIRLTQSVTEDIKVYTLKP